jgi:hypothetical protein
MRKLGTGNKKFRWRACACIPNGKWWRFATQTSQAFRAMQIMLGAGGRGREIPVLATCSLQLIKAGSAATLPQKEKNNSADLLREVLNITGFI